MSTTLLSDPSGLTISRYTGPEPGAIWRKDDPDGADRRRYQITNDAGILITLSRREWKALARFFGSTHVDCSDGCQHPGKEVA